MTDHLTLVSEARLRQLLQKEVENAKLREALEKIKDGGVPNGVQANASERMIAMVDIASEALKDPQGKEE